MRVMTLYGGRALLGSGLLPDAASHAHILSGNKGGISP
jgi:hypothetical protein